MKKDTHIPTDNEETRHYKKKYLVRKLQEQEADREIVLYKENKDENREAERPIDRLDGVGPFRR